MKNKTHSTLKLYVKPEDGKPFGEWEFVWLTKDEIQSYINNGFKRVKKVKGWRETK
jgi:hypothetical protein